MLKCKFYSASANICMLDDPRQEYSCKDEPSECFLFEPGERIEYGSSNVYEGEDEFSKKYCRECSSLVCGGVRDTVAREGCKHYRREMKKEKQVSENDVVTNKPPIKLELVQYPYSKSGPTVYLDDWLIAGPRAFGVGKTVASYELTEGNLKDIQRIVTRELNRLHGVE